MRCSRSRVIGVQSTPKASRDVDGDGGRFRMTGGRPVIALEPAPPAGWHLVSFELDIRAAADTTSAPVALRFLPATGAVVLARRPVPHLADRHRRVVHVPEGTERAEIELSPWIESVGLERVSWRPLSSAAAMSLMAGDVGVSGLGGGGDVRSLAGDVRAAYDTGRWRGALGQIAVAYEHLQHRRAGDGVDYASWRIRNATLFDDDIDRLRRRLASLPGGGPSMSVVMPVHDPEPRWLRAAIESVRAQVYDRWELCIVDDASTDPEVRRLLDESATADDRIRVLHRPENGHIVASTNDGLNMATGEFVTFLDHDDELAPFALAVVALAASGADVVYTDEDKIDVTGRHYDPHCKPSWNPELLLGQNYISHLTAIRRSLVNRVGGLRSGTEGSQDHDLLLRATADLHPDRIVHAPFIAYHWRAAPGSTAHTTAAKRYTEDASLDALRHHLGDGWEIERAAAPTTYRCRPPLPDYPLVSILIPTRDRLDLLDTCIAGLARTTYPAVEVIIVDNDSVEPATLEWLEAFDNGRDRRVIRHPGPFNYSAVNNRGAEAARGEVLCLLNNDTEVIEADWLTEMVRWIGRPDIGVVGARLLYGDDTVQHAGVILGLGGFAGHGHHRRPRDDFGYFSRMTIAHEVGAVTGACLLTRRSTWEALGGLDEELAVAFNDIDYCLRVRTELGQRIIWTPHAELYHHESVSRGAEDDPIKVARFNAEVDRVLERWESALADDPAYSPNLTLEGESFTLARKPRVELPWLDGIGVEQ